MPEYTLSFLLLQKLRQFTGKQKGAEGKKAIQVKHINYDPDTLYVFS